MKKLTIGLGVILTGYAVNSFAGLPFGNSRVYASVPSFCGGFTLGLTGLYWRPSLYNSDYALTDTNITVTSLGILEIGEGRHHRNESNYDWGFKAEVGYVFPCTGNDINLTYTNYDQDDHDSISGEALLFPTLTDTIAAIDFVVVPLPTITLGLPGGGVATLPPGSTTPPFVVGVFAPGSIATASATADFENHTWDIDFGQHVRVGCNLDLRWFGGLRYFDLEHKLNATYTVTSVTTNFVTFITITGEGTVTGTIPFSVTAILRDVVNQKSEYNGIGPRLGMDITYHLCYGFGVIGNISTSLLVGEIESTLSERATLDASAIIAGAVDSTPDGVTAALITPAVASTLIDTASFRHPDETRIVPNIDAKLGLDYSYDFGNCGHTKVIVEAGWQISHYFNAVDSLSEVGSDFPELRTRHIQDVSFDGPYIGIHLKI